MRQANHIFSRQHHVGRTRRLRSIGVHSRTRETHEDTSGLVRPIGRATEGAYIDIESRPPHLVGNQQAMGLSPAERVDVQNTTGSLWKLAPRSTTRGRRNERPPFPRRWNPARLRVDCQASVAAFARWDGRIISGMVTGLAVYRGRQPTLAVAMGSSRVLTPVKSP
jgi:hypothetical protein